MGCGSSKQTVVDKKEIGDKHWHNTATENTQTSPEVKTSAVETSTNIENSKKTLNESDHDAQITNQIPANENTDTKHIHEEGHVDTRETLSPDYSCSSNELDNLEDALADATVFNVLESIQELNQHSDAESKSKRVLEKHVEFDLRPHSTDLISEKSSKPPTPLPSAQPIEKVPSKTEIFLNALHKACSVKDNSQLPTLAAQSDSLRLDRTFYCFNGGGLLTDITSKMNCLRVLDLHGGQCGPVAFRAVTNVLISDHHVMDLNLSDNLANPECSELLGQLLSNNNTLQRLNVSGNLLGRDAFSRYVGAALQGNSALKSLDLSSCGATDLHCLCESLRNSACSALSTLIASHNQITDGHQFAIDLSLILENENCKLKVLDVTNTNISSSGMNAIAASLTANKSLENLLIGQNSVSDVMKIGEFLVNAAKHDCLKELSLNKTKIEGDSVEDFEMSMDGKETSNLSHISIADCGLTDILVQKLSSCMENKLSKLEYLDISNNNDITIQSIELFDKMCSGSLQSLKIALLEQLDGVSSIFAQFSKLENIDFTRSRITHTELSSMSSSCQQTFHSITLNGVKLSGTPAVNCVMTAKCFSCMSSINLSGCQLNDTDIEAISTAIKAKSPKLPIKNMDLSVNRLSSVFLSALVDALLVHDSHPLADLNLANNEIDDAGMRSIIKIWQSSSHTSMLTNINLSCNTLSASSIIDFFNVFKTQTFNLSMFDIRNQKESFGEEDVTSLATTLKEAFFMEDKFLQPRFTINFCGLGGSDMPEFCSLDSSAIQTDFINMRKSTIALNDVLQMGKGLKILNDNDLVNSPYKISLETWTNIIGKDVPKWASVTTELEKSVYISHTPGTVTQQRLQGTLEMDADCEVKDIFLVKDPIMRKPTGAAWVLFEDKQSKCNAIDWYISGNAQMYGTPFLISEIPVCIADETTDAGTLAEQDIAARELELKKKQEEDQRMMKESEQLAAERAEYRAAHPAYQGGRIS